MVTNKVFCSYLKNKNKTQQLYLFTFLPKTKLSNYICLHSSLNSATVFVYIPPKLRNCICLHSSLNSVFVNISPKKQNSAAVFVYIATKLSSYICLHSSQKQNSANVFVIIPPKNKTQQLYFFLHSSQKSATVFVYIPSQKQRNFVFATNSGFLISMALQKFSPSDCKL